MVYISESIATLTFYTKKRLPGEIFLSISPRSLFSDLPAQKPRQSYSYDKALLDRNYVISSVFHYLLKLFVGDLSVVGNHCLTFFQAYFCCRTVNAVDRSCDAGHTVLTVHACDLHGFLTQLGSIQLLLRDLRLAAASAAGAFALQMFICAFPANSIMMITTMTTIAFAMISFPPGYLCIPLQPEHPEQ